MLTHNRATWQLHSPDAQMAFCVEKPEHRTEKSRRKKVSIHRIDV